MSEQKLTEDLTICDENISSIENETPTNGDTAINRRKRRKTNQTGSNDNIKLQELLVKTSIESKCQEQSAEVVSAAEVDENTCSVQHNACSTSPLGKRKKQKNDQDALKKNGAELDTLKIVTSLDGSHLEDDVCSQPLANKCLKSDDIKSGADPIVLEDMSPGQYEIPDLNGSYNGGTRSCTINNSHGPQIVGAVPVPEVKARNSTCKQDASSMPKISEQLCFPPICVNSSSMNNLQEHVDADYILDEENSTKTYPRKRQRQKDAYSQENSLEVSDQAASSWLPKLASLTNEGRNTGVNCPDNARALGCLVDVLKQKLATSIMVEDDRSLQNPLGASSDLQRASMENTANLEDTAIGNVSVKNVLVADLAGENYEHAERSKQNAENVPCGQHSVEEKMESSEKAQPLANKCLKLDDIKNDADTIDLEDMRPGQFKKIPDLNESYNGDPCSCTINNSHGPQIVGAVPVSEVNAINSTCKQDDRSLKNPLGVSSDLERASMENTNNLEDTAIGNGSVKNVLVADLAGENYEHAERPKQNAELNVPCGQHSVEEKMESSEKAPTEGSTLVPSVASLDQKTQTTLEDSAAFSSELGPALVNVAQPINQSSLEKVHSSCSRKKLLVLDVNGILADIVPNEELRYQPDALISSKAVFKRPFCDDFLKYCFEKFDVGVWSSRTKKNVQRILDFLIRGKGYNLLFCWDQSHCTNTGYNTLENKDKPLVLKELKKLWEKQDPDLPWERGDYNESNTLLLDDSPYKALLNPPNTGICPYPFVYWCKVDNALAARGHLRGYLERLAGANNVQKFVEQHPFGQLPITRTSACWPFYLKVIGTVSSQMEAGKNSSLVPKPQLEAGENSSLVTISEPEVSADGSLPTKSQPEAGGNSCLVTLEAGDNISLAVKSKLEADESSALATEAQPVANDVIQPETADINSSAMISQPETSENSSSVITH